MDSYSLDRAIVSECQSGRVERISQLVKEGGDIDTQNDSIQCTPLMYASASGHGNVVLHLLSIGAEVNRFDRYGRSALIHACMRNGNVGVVGVLLLNNSDVDFKDNNSKTALMHACDTRDTDMIRKLLSHNVNANKRDSRGKTALMHAVASSKFEIVKLLVECGQADVMMSDNDHRSVLMHLNGNDANIADYLCRKGSDVNHRVQEGSLTLTVLPYLLFKLPGGLSSDLVKIFLKHGADPKYRCTEGLTLLMMAILYQHGVDIVKVLILNGADVNTRDCQDLSPLIFAVINYKSTMMFEAMEASALGLCEVLLCSGAVVCYELHCAVMGGLTKLVDLMFRYGALPQLQASVPTVMQEVFMNKTVTSVNKMPDSLLLTAFLHGNCHTVNQLLDKSFLTQHDLYPPVDTKQAVAEHLYEKGRTDSNCCDRLECEKCLDVMANVYKQPWSLKTLSIVRVSSSLGFTSERRQRIKATGLPKFIQEHLMFGAEEVVEEKTDLGKHLNLKIASLLCCADVELMS